MPRAMLLVILFVGALVIGAWTHGNPGTNCIQVQSGTCLGANINSNILVQ